MAAIGQVPLGERPDSFIGIEFRGVGGEMLDVKTGMSAEQVLERFPVVSGGINDHRAAQMSQQFPQKSADLLLPDVGKEEQIVEAQWVPLGVQGNSGDDEDPVPPMTMHGSLGLWSPGLDHVGNQQEARFIDED